MDDSRKRRERERERGIYIHTRTCNKPYMPYFVSTNTEVNESIKLYEARLTRIAQELKANLQQPHNVLLCKEQLGNSLRKLEFNVDYILTHFPEQCVSHLFASKGYDGILSAMGSYVHWYRTEAHGNLRLMRCKEKDLYFISQSIEYMYKSLPRNPFPRHHPTRPP